MRPFTRIVFGSLLGISLILAGSTQAKASDNCLLIVCVDAPIVGPLVGGLGDALEEVLTPSQPETPTQPQPPVEPPVQPPVQPQSPSTGGQPDSPPDSESTVETERAPEPAVTPSTSATPAPSPTPTQTKDPLRMLPDEGNDENHPLHHVGVLTPFVVGVLLMLLIVLSVTSFARYFQSRRQVAAQDQSALPHKKI